MRTASRPDSISGPCSPSPEGIARRISSARGPASPAGSPASLGDGRVGGLRRGAAPVLCVARRPRDHERRLGIGGRGLAEHDRGVQQAALACSRSGSAARPAAPMLPPSVETKTSDFSWVVPEKPGGDLRAGSPSRRCSSRRRCPRRRRGGRSRRPGARSCRAGSAIRFRSSTSSPSKRGVEGCSATSADGIASKRSWTNSAIASSESEPGRGSGELARPCRGPGRRRPRRRTSRAASVDSSGSGGCCSENIATTSATGAASRAILHMRRSITAVP